VPENPMHGCRLLTPSSTACAAHPGALSDSMSGPPEAQVFAGRHALGLNVFLLSYPGGRLGSSRGSTQVDLFGMELVAGFGVP
jgi:hypothetical protein